MKAKKIFSRAIMNFPLTRTEFSAQKSAKSAAAERVSRGMPINWLFMFSSETSRRRVCVCDREKSVADCELGHLDTRHATTQDDNSRH